ncbi:MAG TPA: hypothetical protein VF881_13620, partial [Polyangiaceae bacterium]
MRSELAWRPSAAEFPHDNPLVDRCALWIGGPLCSIENAVPQAPVPPAEKPESADPIATFVRT